MAVGLIILLLGMLSYSCEERSNHQIMREQEMAAEASSGKVNEAEVEGEPTATTPDNPYLKEIADRQIEGTSYLKGGLWFALQEDGSDDVLWRLLHLETEPVIHDISTNVTYVRVPDGKASTFGIVYPQRLEEVAYGWVDETGFPFSRVVELDGERYVSLEEIAEKNGAFIYRTNGYGDVSYFPKTLLEFMQANYYKDAFFAGPAWRKIALARAADR